MNNSSVSRSNHSTRVLVSICFVILLCVVIALWFSKVNAANINNGANSSNYGFTDVSWEGNHGVIAMNGINIGVEMPTANTIVLSFS